MDKEKIETKPLWILATIVFLIVIIYLGTSLYHTTEKLKTLEKLPLTTVRGSYYSGDVFGLYYTMAFSETQFILQYNNKTVDVADYEKSINNTASADEYNQYNTVYRWRSETDSGFIALQCGGIAVYFSGTNEIITLKKEADHMIIFGPDDPRFDISGGAETGQSK